MHIRGKLEFLRENWKLCIHLLFRTRRFGVNNEWRSSFDSYYFGDSLWRIVLNILMCVPIIRNYRSAKYRAIKLGFLHPDTRKKIGWH